MGAGVPAVDVAACFRQTDAFFAQALSWYLFANACAVCSSAEASLVAL